MASTRLSFDQGGRGGGRSSTSQGQGAGHGVTMRVYGLIKQDAQASSAVVLGIY